MKRSFLLYFILIAFHLTLSAQNYQEKNNFKNGLDILHRAYIKYDYLLFEESKNIFNSILEKNSLNSNALYYLTYTYYRLTEYGFIKGNDSLFNTFYSKVLNSCDQLLKDNILRNEAKLIKAGAYMFMIGKDFASGPTLFPQLQALLKEVEEEEPLNPRCYVLKGRMKFNTPSMFGGSKEEALIYFNKAKEIYEDKKIKPRIELNWEYTEALVWLSKTYEIMGKIDVSEKINNKILEIEPEFGLFKCLLPK